MATIFVRALGTDVKGKAAGLTFTDSANISAYAADSVAYAVELGLINGRNDNTFNPRGTATREAVAKVADLYIVKKEEIKAEEPPETEPELPEEPSEEPAPEPSIPTRPSNPSPSVPVNHAPTVVNTLENLTGRVGDHKEVSLANVFTDIDGDVLSVNVANSNPDIATVSKDGDFIYINMQEVGNTRVTLTATDGKGGSVSQTFSITVSENQVPVVSNAIGNKGGTVGSEMVIDLTDVFGDDDGDELTISSNIGSVENGTWIYTPISSDSGKTLTVRLTADDNKGGSVSQTFEVSIGQLNPVSFVTLHMETGDGIDFGPFSTIPSEMITSTPNEEGKIVFEFEQDLETGGIDYYDFMMKNVTINFSSQIQITVQPSPYITRLTEVSGKAAAYYDQFRDQEGNLSVSYGELVKNGDGVWSLTPNTIQTFQTPGIFTLETTVQDENGNDYTFEVILEITEAESPPLPTITVESTTIPEADANDGSITAKQVVMLTNGTFDDDMGTGVTINNLPEGLTTTITRDSDTQMTISFVEKATLHANVNDVTNATVTIDKSKILGATSDLTTGAFTIDFADPLYPAPDVDKISMRQAGHSYYVWGVEGAATGAYRIELHSTNDPDGSSYEGREVVYPNGSFSSNATYGYSELWIRAVYLDSSMNEYYSDVVSIKYGG